MSFVNTQLIYSKNQCRPTRGCRRLGQSSARSRWNAVLEFLLKYQQQIGCGQAPEPPAVGRFSRKEAIMQNFLMRFKQRMDIISFKLHHEDEETKRELLSSITDDRSLNYEAKKILLQQLFENVKFTNEQKHQAIYSNFILAANIEDKKKWLEMIVDEDPNNLKRRQEYELLLNSSSKNEEEIK
jgi:hypothetical protein